MIAVVFGMMSAFPVFQSLKQGMEQFVYHNFVPTAGERCSRSTSTASWPTPQQHHGGRHRRPDRGGASCSSRPSTRTSTTSGVRPESALAQAFAMYWMILTLGPVLIGASLAISLLYPSLQAARRGQPVRHPVTCAAQPAVPFSVLTFLLIHTVVPNCRVRLTHAFIGALVAASSCSSWLNVASPSTSPTSPPTRPSMVPWQPSPSCCLGVSELAGGVAGAETTACPGEYEKPGAEELG